MLADAHAQPRVGGTSPLEGAFAPVHDHPLDLQREGPGEFPGGAGCDFEADVEVVAPLHERLADRKSEGRFRRMEDALHDSEPFVGVERLPAAQTLSLVPEHIGGCPRPDGRQGARVDEACGAEQRGVEIRYRQVDPFERIRPPVRFDADLRDDTVPAAGHDRDPGGEDLYPVPGRDGQPDVQQCK